jgi:hypothetical protein
MLQIFPNKRRQFPITKFPLKRHELKKPGNLFFKDFFSNSFFYIIISNSFVVSICSGVAAERVRTVDRDSTVNGAGVIPGRCAHQTDIVISIATVMPKTVCANQGNESANLTTTVRVVTSTARIKCVLKKSASTTTSVHRARSVKNLVFVPNMYKRVKVTVIAVYLDTSA